MRRWRRWFAQDWVDALRATLAPGPAPERAERGADLRVQAPGQARKPTVLVLDNGPIHTSKASLAALAARSAWLTVEWLPRYAPELNAIENTWRDLKRHHLAHRTFRDADALDRAVHQAVADLNRERSRMHARHTHPCHNLPMAA